MVVLPVRRLVAGQSHWLPVLAVSIAAALALSTFCRVDEGSLRASEALRNQRTACYFTPIPADALVAPNAMQVAVPPVPADDAIWGSTGRDGRGCIWFGVSTVKGPKGSAYLIEYDPESAKMTHRGDVLSELARLGLAEEGQGQVYIQTRITLAADGNLYFASTDLEGADFVAGSRPPIWGSHLWRIRLPENRWEHLAKAPDALLAMSGTGYRIYILGFPGHRLCQYDCRTGGLRSVEVGSVEGHFSRNIVSDHRDHVYVPRLRVAPASGETVVTLVEYDEELREVAQSPLRYYIVGTPTNSHGLTGFQPMADGSIIILTSMGFLHRIVPRDGGPAQVAEVGWLHPDGPRYASALFTYAGERYVMGLTTGSKDRETGTADVEWCIHDLETGKATAWPVDISGSPPLPLGAALLYGSVTRDNNGNFYLAGRSRSGQPLIVKVECP